MALSCSQRPALNCWARGLLRNAQGWEAVVEAEQAGQWVTFMGLDVVQSGAAVFLCKDACAVRCALCAVCCALCAVCCVLCSWAPALSPCAF